MSNDIVILGWGSLIYELGILEEFVKLKWHDGSPKLPIEFSRISSTRNRALTLVIDPVNGVTIPTKYIVSKRKDPKDAACDLCEREGTVKRHIGIIDLKKNHENYNFPKVAEKIKKWCEDRGFRAVIWTDLQSNFKEESYDSKEFSILAAVNHLNSLSETGKRKAKAYLKDAPEFVNTPLRQKLISENWY
jgi:hypothetical protein